MTYGEKINSMCEIDVEQRRSIVLFGHRRRGNVWRSRKRGTQTKRKFEVRNFCRASEIELLWAGPRRRRGCMEDRDRITLGEKKKCDARHGFRTTEIAWFWLPTGMWCMEIEREWHTEKNRKSRCAELF